MTREVWPNFFIVGTMKGGTTSLYHYLRAVPTIYMSPNKEPNFFAADEIRRSASRIVIRDKNKYLSLFANVTNEEAIGEASTNYLYSTMAPKRIYEILPESRILIILRDPIQRAFSHYLSNVKNKNLGVHKLSFLEALKRDYSSDKKGIGISILYIERGLYYQQVKRYLDLFGKKQVKVLIFEEYVSRIHENVQEVINFLDIDADPPTNIDETYNRFFIPRNPFSHSVMASRTLKKIAELLPESRLKTLSRKSLLSNSIPKPKISEETKEYLAAIFQDDVKKLESLLGRSLPWQI